MDPGRRPAPHHLTPLRLDAVVARCWPGEGDRTDPVARAWLRAWRPARAAVAAPRCTCAAGPCGVCN